MRLAIFVNSCDSFQDCWVPFFKLFEIYGSVLRSVPIYLNTERAEFNGDRSNINCTKVWRMDEQALPPWSERLIRGLDATRADYIVCFQEDYFLRSPVEPDLIQEALNIFTKEPDAGVVHLSLHGPKARRRTEYSTNFIEVHPPADYLINTQAAIWDKNFLRSVARSWENVWMFEKFGTWRARNTGRRIFAPSDAARENCRTLDYVWTGVTKGKWKLECAELFHRHGITVDFERRGFYREGGLLKYRLRLQLLHKLFGRPVPAIRSISSLFQRASIG